ncbi:MAG TPA: helix-turn-helix domain-containing protein [Phycisphaerae bacterium]|nr:helix-turn-helix domain-containing protein [Phycisphaerae bacterium]
MGRKKTSNAVGILRKRYPPTEDDLKLSEEFRQGFEIAQQVYDLRTSAGLTQKELAERVGTTPSVISRLEDADYDRHSMAMLRRIAKAVGHRVQVRFVPDHDGNLNRA